MRKIERYFSIRNEDIHKVVTIFGIKIKFKSKLLQLQTQLQDLTDKLNIISTQEENHKNEINKVQNEINKVQNEVNKAQNEIIHKTQEEITKKVQEQSDKLSAQMTAMQRSVNRVLDRQVHINRNVNTIFRYQTGIELNKNFIMERQIVFDPNDVPLDHYNRYEFALQHLKEGEKVADIACTCGYGSKILSERASKVIGIDINENVINFANKVFGGDKITFMAQDAQDLQLQDTFDTIVSFETIEHIPHPELFLQKAHDLLKPHGKIICSVPNENVNSYEKSHNKFHFRHYTEQQFKELLEQFGFKIEEFYHQYWDDNFIIAPKTDEKEGMVIVAVATKE